MEEFYPMPAFAMLLVSDVAASRRWYSETVGFRVVYETPGLEVVHLRRERYQDLLLLPLPAGQSAQPCSSLILNFNAMPIPLAEIAATVQSRGARYEGPVKRPWNTVELTVYDPDGYALRFNEPLQLGRDFEEVMQEAQKSLGK